MELVKLTTRAYKKITEVLKEKNDPDCLGLRLNLKTRGCSGHML